MDMCDNAILAYVSGYEKKISVYDGGRAGLMMSFY